MKNQIPEIPYWHLNWLRPSWKVVLATWYRMHRCLYIAGLINLTSIIHSLKTGSKVIQVETSTCTRHGSSDIKYAASCSYLKQTQA